MCLCHAPGARRSSVVSRRAVTTRRRFAQLLVAGASLPALAACDPADLGQAFVSEEQVEQLGLQAWEQIKSDEPHSANAEHQRRARTIADRVLAAAGENPDSWEVVVFAGDQANAFALPGNKIGVYDGMFAMAEDDDQLAAVIGHEIGHNQAAHSQQRVAREVGTQAGLQLVGAALQVGQIGYASEIAGLLGAGAQYGIILPYSREQELEADELGLRNMARAGYDPHGAVQLWENMSRQPSPPEFASTHPAPEGRIEALEAMMPEALELYRAGG